MQTQSVDIKKYLPHRTPMLMVDEIISIDDHQVITNFKIQKNNIFVKNNIFLESGLIENAAQTCSAIVAQPLFTSTKKFLKKELKVIGFISAIKNLKVHQLPQTESLIQTKAVLGSRFDTDDYALCTMFCSTLHEENLLFEAEINLFIQEERL